MRRVYVPTYVAPSIYEIPFSFYKGLGVKILLVDLDNTLAPYSTKLADANAREWARKAKEEGFEVAVVSNNSGRRVGRFANSLGTPYLFHSLKPFAFRILSFLKRMGYRKEEAILLGDQIHTDVVSANRGGIKSVLLSPLTKDDPFITRYNRKREGKKRAEIYAKSLSTLVKEDN